MIVIGEGLLDIYLDLDSIKLGGVFHYAHVLESLKIKSKIYHISPAYLQAHLNALSYKYVEFIKVGEIYNCPNIITVGDSSETGNQNYKNVLDNIKETKIDLDKLSKILVEDENQLFILPSSFKITELKSIIKKFKGQVYIDIAYDLNREELKNLDHQFEIIFLSTSSEFFVKEFDCNVQKLKNWIIPKYAKILIFKENRGGSRIFTNEEVFSIPSQISKLIHSVGVGDCYNTAFISKYQKLDYILAGKFASKLASIYGQHNSMEDYTSALNELTPDDYQLDGVVLPWEKRKDISIYIAAPDFDYIDTSIIDSICSKMIYHNFKPVRPIKINGEVTSRTSIKDRKSIVKNDIKLINNSRLLVAIMLFKDEGTIAEIGYAAALGKPIIIYDPKKMINNAFVENISKKIVFTIDDLINSIFIIMNNIE